MRLIRNLLGMSVLAIAFNACFEAPQFPDAPEITYNDIVFKDLPAPDAADTLIITVNFRDGDGDLGLHDSETAYPFNDKYYFTSSGEPGYFAAGTAVANDASLLTALNGSTYPTGKLLSWASKMNGNDTLPDFVTPYSCSNWDVLKDPVTGKDTDTLYFQLNPNHYNFFVDFYVQQGDGSFALYDWKKEFVFRNCNVNGFNGRFPILSKDLSQRTAQEGKIRYSMKSVGFNIFFSIKVLKLRIYIQDRNLHKSGVIETPAFTLQSIRK